MIKKNDLILVGVILLLGIITLFVINAMKTEGSQIEVTIGGKAYKTFDLNKDTTFTLKDENGDWNSFVIKDGYVDMIDANCPDKICVNHKSIHYNHETIVCLPHKVVLEIINGEENEVDAVAE